MKRIKIRNFVFLMLISTLLLSGLPTTNGLQVSSGDDVLIYAMPYDFDEYSDFTSDSYATSQWNSAVYAGLVKRASENGRDWVADLAASLPEISADGLTFTFTLKDDLRFSNGHKLTTSDVEFSWKARLSPAVNTNDYGDFLGFFDNSSINVIDEKTVSFELLKPFAFPYTLLSFYITDEEIFGARYDNCVSGVAEDCLWNDPNGADAIGAGPFMVDDIDNVHEIVTVVSNPFYYNAAEMSTDKIIFQKITEKESAISSLAGGLVDIVDSQYVPSLNDFADLEDVTEDFVGDPSHQEVSINHLNPYFGTGEMIPGNTAPDFADALLVRKAMSHILDRKFAVDEIYEGLALPAATAMPAASLGWDASLVPRNFSVDVARNYMEQAGFDYSTLGTENPDGTFDQGFFEVTVLSPNTNPARNQWSANYVLELPKIGISVTDHVSTGWGEIIPRTFGYSGGLVPSYAEGGYDVFFVGYSWALDWNPISLYDAGGRCDSGDCGNFYNFDVEEDQTEVSAMVQEYLTELDFDARQDKAKTLQQELYDTIPVLPILYPQSHWGWASDISGIDSLLISVSSQEWDLVVKDGFVKNDVDTETLLTEDSDGDDTPLNEQSIILALVSSTLIMMLRYRRK